LVEAGDVNGFAKAMLDLLDDTVKRGHLGKNARQHAVEQYSWEQYTRRLEEIYLSVVS
jgi:glycosyltransferase involved in cell wall biosynthesis